MFIGLTPFAGLIVPKSAPAASALAQPQAKNPVPIVMIVFDEFEAGALLDGNRRIDAVRYPNFAALAESGLWFPNATTVWTETQRAVPAILTGLRPHDPNALPSVQSHPDNLFTWLSREGYRLNVTEPLTSLCPPDLCRAPEGQRTGFEPQVFLSDLGVIFLHIVVPGDYARKHLPRMDTTWRGFGAKGAGAQPSPTGQKNFRAEFNQIVTGDRRPLVASFIDSIAPGDRPALNFLHVLLPHDPYLYLPSGSMYFGGNTEGLVDRTWTADDLLPKLAYQRYLLQVGYVDSMIGRVVARLKETGLYDKTLIVVTADHGKSFRPGQPKRTLAAAVLDNAPDLMQVPLFVKLPAGAAAGRSEKRALTVDILPTIAEVLGTELPWRADGVSLLRERFPERDVLEIASLGEAGPGHRFQADQLTSYPRLPWKLETFGARTPLGRIAIADPHAALVGRNLAELEVDREVVPGWEIASDQYGLLTDVNPGSGILPILFQGTIRTGAGAPGPVNLAVTLNGVVQVTTRTTEWGGSPHYFAAMIPEEAFREGRNEVDVFRIEESGGRPRLARIRAPGQEQFRLARDSDRNEVLISATDTPVPMRPEAVMGHLDTAEEYSGWFTLSGWAVDKEHLSPVPRILVFVDGKQVFSGNPTKGRPDLVKHFKTEGVLWSGFRFNVPKSAFGNGDVRLYAISESGKASQLVISNPAGERLKAAGKSQG
jgi:Sulfatase